MAQEEPVPDDADADATAAPDTGRRVRDVSNGKEVAVPEPEPTPYISHSGNIKGLVDFTSELYSRLPALPAACSSAPPEQ
jgi:hypothetical protein